KKIYNIAMSTVITMTFPLAAVFLYFELGDTRGLLPQAQLANATQMQGAGGDSPAGHDNFSSVVENLIARLSDNPDDIEGWVMLGRTYAIMGRYNEASNTYQKLTELVPNNAQILSDYADVLAMRNQGSLVGRPAELINEALEADPEYPKALALAGTAEFEQERFEQAAEHWEKLLTVIPDDSELAKSVNTSIAEARSLASGGSGYPAQQTAAYQEPEQVAEPEVVEVASAATESATRSLSGQVLISGTVASKASPDDTVFIYARAKTGSRQPLGILQMKVSDLPAAFTLADGMSMRPGVKLSSFPDEVVIEARITKSGQAMPSSGDLQGFSDPVMVGTSNISIVIDQQIP
ncbi:MAG: c-type cytochrome biogenesis protein CcmI, partial [Betaproteobacteria bacterium]|nr:c-type cytochrome biogenesis protein CcmI [Betaproteobacteria bacterium]